MAAMTSVANDQSDQQIPLIHQGKHAEMTVTLEVSSSLQWC